MKFLWTTIHVKNMQESMDFYTKAVGLTIDRHFESPTGKVLCFLGDGETKVELIYGPDDEVTMSKSISIGFPTDSVEQKIKELSDLGIDVYEGPIQPNPNLQFFYVLDPNGLKVQFVEFIE